MIVGKRDDMERIIELVEGYVEEFKSSISYFEKEKKRYEEKPKNDYYEEVINECSEHIESLGKRLENATKLLHELKESYKILDLNNSFNRYER